MPCWRGRRGLVLKRFRRTQIKVALSIVCPGHSRRASVDSSKSMATGYAHPTGSARGPFGLADPVGGEKTFDFKALGVYCQRILSPKSEREPPWEPPVSFERYRLEASG